MINNPCCFVRLIFETVILRILCLFVFEWCMSLSHLTVQSQKDDHDEEAAGPQRGERHHGHSARIGYEGQTWT